MLRDVQRDPLLILILSLYFLLLAFFILLNSISQVEEVRAKVVAGSLESTFAGSGRPAKTPAAFTSSLGDALGQDTLVERLGALVRAELRLGSFEVLQPGRLMRLKMSESALFASGETGVSDDGRGLLEGIGWELAAPAKGVRYVVEIRLGTGQGAGAGLATDGMLDRTRRAAALAQTLAEAGAPNGSVAGGLEPGPAGEARFLFHVRPVVEPALIDKPAGG